MRIFAREQKSSVLDIISLLRQIKESANKMSIIDKNNCEAAFQNEMAGRSYGEEETNDARAWFIAGWNAAKAPAPVNEKPIWTGHYASEQEYKDARYSCMTYCHPETCNHPWNS